MNGAPSAMVSPGLWGFIAFFVLALALYLLMRNMNARMRRMSYRAEEREREAEQQAGPGRSTPDSTPEGPSVAGDGDGHEGQTGEPRT